MKYHYDHIRLDIEIEKPDQKVRLLDQMWEWLSTGRAKGQITKGHGGRPWPAAATRCLITNDDGQITWATGYSFCSSKDQFNKKLGRTIARGRAEKEMR
jgi:hypothetical protein